MRLCKFYRLHRLRCNRTQRFDCPETHTQCCPDNPNSIEQREFRNEDSNEAKVELELTGCNGVERCARSALGSGNSLFERAIDIVLNMPQSMDDPLSPEQLERALASKDQVIAALTEQLEGTVEHLDRLQRAGARLGGRESESHSSGLAAKVEAALQAYDDLDPGDRLDRIEAGIEQILEIVSNGSAKLSASPGESRDDNSEQSDQENDDAFWESTKARLLSGNTDSTTDSADSNDYSPSPSSSSDGEETQEESPSAQPDAAEIPPLPPLPTPIETTTDAVALEEAVTERDVYIRYLIGRLRAAESARYAPLDWQQLAAAPDELTESLRQLQKQLRDHLKQAEVAVALERASLARERSKLFQVKQLLEGEVKRIGAAAMAAQQSESGDDADQRIGRFLAVNKPE